MDEGVIKSNGSCTHAAENEHEHGFEHDHVPGHGPDLDLNRNSNDKETLTMPAEKVSPDEHAEVRLPDDSGVCSQDSNHLNSSEHVDVNVLGNHPEETELAKSDKLGHSSPPPTEASTSPTQAKSPTSSTKGYGLKKWRRIKRDVPKDATTNLDSIKMLKRGPANVLDAKQPSDVSVSSTDAVVQSLGGADGFGIPGPSSNYNLPVNTTFSAGADSDNSEDRSSKSSTAASAPKHRHDALRAMGHQRDKHRAKSVGGRNLGAGGLRSQAGKAVGVADASKKPRGASVNIEKENSLSSMESDSRNYSVFIRGMSSIIGDQTQNGTPLNPDTEDADDEPASEEHYAEELTADFSKNISVSQESSSDASKANGKNHQLPKDCDPLVNSILMLQFAQAALEKEVQQFGEIGKGIHSFCEDLAENTSSPVCSMPGGPEVCTDDTSDGWGSVSNHVSLNKNMQTLERQLGEAEGRVKAKELKISELEATMKSMESPLKDIECTIQQQQKRSKEIEAELEGLFKQKVEAEVEFIAMTRSNKELGTLVENHIELLKEQKYLVKELARSSRTALEVENKAIMLKGKLEEVDSLYEERTGSEEVLKMQKTVVKFTKCLFVQLILLLLVFGVFFSQLSPKSAVVVPT